VKSGFGLIHCVVFVLASGLASAQGGPPMVTDDPDTPGDGHWEINLGSIGSETFRRWDIAALDADINYGWGEHVQLKLDAPWTYTHTSASDWNSGLGAVDVGVKWRFIDEDDHGFSMSTYPQFLSAWSTYSKQHGIASADKEFFLPIEIAGKAAGFEFTTEFGRNFIQNGADQWEAGVVAAHACGSENLECLLEVHETQAPHDAQTLLNFGIHLKLNESLIFLAAAGRDFGPRTDDQQRFLYYAGLQILR
jgi:hypothetical protein